MQLEYFNTSSSKCILDVFKRLEPIRSAGNEVTVLWHYEADDEDMLEAGEDYSGIINIPFKMIQIAEVEANSPHYPPARGWKSFMSFGKAS